MTEVTLSNDQVRLFSEAQGPIALCDAAGNHIGVVSRGWTVDDLMDIEQRLHSDKPGFPTSEILRHLEALQQITEKTNLKRNRLLDLALKARDLPQMHDDSAREDIVTALAREFGISSDDVRTLQMQPLMS